MTKISFFNNKGGVGKSTSAINVAHAMTRLGLKVIVVDCDSQKNTFRFFADELNEHSRNATRYDNLEIATDVAYWQGGRDWQGDNYNFVIFDLPPALNERTQLILSSCDFVFVPFELGKFAIQGIAKVTEAIAESGVKLGGCFVNKFDRENPVSHKLDTILRNTLGDKAMTMRIPYSRVIKNSIDYRQTAFEYMEWTVPAKQYATLTREILTICREVSSHA
jgi:chromosome partitioning protein